jgi:hypothetical protein
LRALHNKPYQEHSGRFAVISSQHSKTIPNALGSGWAPDYGPGLLTPAADEETLS